jgi:solute carrier family 35 protein F1/2
MARGAGVLLHLFLWQICSLLLTGTGYFSQRIATLGIDAPTAQSSLAYILLATHWAPLLLRRRRQPRTACAPAERLRWWHWAAIAAADVEANYLLVLAYQYTDITAVCILDAFSVPTVIVVAAAAFGRRHSARQLGAAALCVLGIGVLVAADLVQGRRGARLDAPESGGHAWIGDVLVLCGAALYGCSNVAQEYLVRRVVDRVEYLAHLGLYGALIGVTQASILERSALAAAWNATGMTIDGGMAGSTSWLPTLIGLESGFVVALCGFYILVAWLLEHGSSATTMNLSLLTSDFWAVLVGVGLLHSRPGLVYACAFALTIGGLLLYHLTPQQPTGLDTLAVGVVEEDGQCDTAGACRAVSATSGSLSEPLVSGPPDNTSQPM